ncbi:DNA-binding transcriptional activator KdpE [Streptomyces lavendulae subsp. lavendulae]|uniref:DNA-binding transcriptional activator KdpE n=1 Tax=Streptomyces lavendulae subsp. lavendulae TaxID=58340 RepID=A0A2K8PTG4_STRLA|nr:DNA-binding transcriptional activator KdpE [Streptomyces lavendulae subsp. lavendulae]QUQ58950.1 hypothetical protein SLLC_35005 [Streptomyces lavendulae subsp. lavendulae]
MFLTAHHALDDRLTRFSAGGNDYLAKPFHPRRARRPSAPAAAGALLLDPPVDLTPTEFRLPAVLIAAAGGLVTHGALVSGRAGPRGPG